MKKYPKINKPKTKFLTEIPQEIEETNYKL